MTFLSRFLIIVSLSFSLCIREIFALTEVQSPTGLLPQVGTNPGDTIATVIAFFITVTAILAVIAITWGAIQMILASGEEEKIKKSRMIIIYAFVGLIVAGIAFGVVQAITNLRF